MFLKGKAERARARGRSRRRAFRAHAQIHQPSLPRVALLFRRARNAPGSMKTPRHARPRGVAATIPRLAPARAALRAKARLPDLDEEIAHSKNATSVPRNQEPGTFLPGPACAPSCLTHISEAGYPHAEAARPLPNTSSYSYVYPPTRHRDVTVRRGGVPLKVWCHDRPGPTGLSLNSAALAI